VLLPLILLVPGDLPLGFSLFIGRSRHGPSHVDGRRLIARLYGAPHEAGCADAIACGGRHRRQKPGGDQEVERWEGRQGRGTESQPELNQTKRRVDAHHFHMGGRRLLLNVLRYDNSATSLMKMSAVLQT